MSNDKGLEEIPEGMFLLWIPYLWPFSPFDGLFGFFVVLVIFFHLRCRVKEGKKDQSTTPHKPTSNVRSRLTRLFQSTGQIETNYDEITDSFDAMELKPELLRGMC